MIDVPVVFICFNRLKLIKTTFLKIAKQKPQKLYIIMDGPRSSVSTDKRKILNIHETLNPLSHIVKNEICEGDASIELEKYLDREKHTIIALAYFDFDLYEPTKKCLELIKDRITKGTIIGFDELNDPDSPGETLALMETIGLKNIKLKRYSHCSRVSYFEVE